MPAPIRWVLFDAVGTLIYPDPPVARVYCETGRRFGSRLEEDEVSRRFRQAFAAEVGSADNLNRPPTSEANELARWWRIVAAVIHDVPATARDELFQSLWQHFAQPQHWSLYTDVEPALRRLPASGLRLGIASNFDSRLPAIVAVKPELAACQRVFVSSQIGFSKPDPRFFATVTVQLEVPTPEILLVGDDWLADVRGATAAGWQASWLNRESERGDGRAIASLSELAIG